jgi:hypothetical protein
MKAALIILILTITLPVLAANPTNDVIAIQAATSATEIRPTRNGYSITTPSGTRTAYKTPTGYYIEGGRGASNLQIIRSGTGYRVESSATRGAAFSNR